MGEEMGHLRQPRRSEAVELSARNAQPGFPTQSMESAHGQSVDIGKPIHLEPLVGLFVAVVVEIPDPRLELRHVVNPRTGFDERAIAEEKVRPRQRNEALDV